MFTIDSLGLGQQTLEEQVLEIYDKWQLRYNKIDIGHFKRIRYEVQSIYPKRTINEITVQVDKALSDVHTEQRGRFINMVEIRRRVLRYYKSIS